MAAVWSRSFPRCLEWGNQGLEVKQFTQATLSPRPGKSWWSGFKCRPAECQSPRPFHSIPTHPRLHWAWWKWKKWVVHDSMSLWEGLKEVLKRVLDGFLMLVPRTPRELRKRVMSWWGVRWDWSWGNWLAEGIRMFTSQQFLTQGHLLLQPC